MFNADYQRVRNEELPEAVRFLAFLHCIENYCWLKKQQFQETYICLGTIFGFSWKKKPDGEKLTRAVEYLKDERRIFLEKLREFAQRRRIEKAQGQRVPRQEQIIELYSRDCIGTCNERFVSSDLLTSTCSLTLNHAANIWRHLLKFLGRAV